MWSNPISSRSKPEDEAMTMPGPDHRADGPAISQRRRPAVTQTLAFSARGARMTGPTTPPRFAAVIAREAEAGEGAGLPAIRRCVLEPGQARTFAGALF